MRSPFLLLLLIFIFGCDQNKEQTEILKKVHTTRNQLTDFHNNINKHIQLYLDTKLDLTKSIKNLMVNNEYIDWRNQLTQNENKILDSLMTRQMLNTNNYHNAVVKLNDFNFDWITKEEKAINQLENDIETNTIELSNAKIQLEKIIARINKNSVKSDSLFEQFHSEAIKEIIKTGTQIEVIDILKKTNPAVYK